MPEPFAVAGADYLEQLLHAAVHVPAASADPAGGRVVARLIAALGARGEDERLEPYLSCSPGSPSVFEVTCYDETDRPASSVTGLGVASAIRAASRSANARSDRTVEVVARDDAGHERCVLVVKGSIATYQFPEPGVVARDVVGPTEDAATTGRPEPSEAPWAALAERLESLPTTDDVITALREVLGGMAGGLGERIGSLPTTDEVVSAVRDLLSEMTIELDATAIEDLIHAALDDVAQVTTSAAPDVVDDRPVPPSQEMDTGDGAAVPYGVSINATQVADLVPEPAAGSSGRVRLTDARPADRPVEETLVLVARSSRRPERP